MSEETERPEHLDPAAALRQVATIDRRSRATARWPALIWLALAVSMPVYLIGSEVVPPGTAHRIVGWSPIVVVAVLFAVAATRRSESLLMRRLTPVVTAAYVAAVLLCVVAKALFLPDGYSVGLLILGLLPSVPCLYGAVRILVS